MNLNKLTHVFVISNIKLLSNSSIDNRQTYSEIGFTINSTGKMSIINILYIW